MQYLDLTEADSHPESCRRLLDLLICRLLSLCARRAQSSAISWCLHSLALLSDAQEIKEGTIQAVSDILHVLYIMSQHAREEEVKQVWGQNCFTAFVKAADWSPLQRTCPVILS